MDQVRVDTAERTFLVVVEYKNIPYFCSICHSIGHAVASCRRNQVHDKQSGKPRDPSSSRKVNSKVWIRPKKVADSPSNINQEKHISVHNGLDNSGLDHINLGQREGKKVLSQANQFEDNDDSALENINADALILPITNGNIMIREPPSPVELSNHEQHTQSLGAVISSPSIATNLQVVLHADSYGDSNTDTGIRSSTGLETKKKGNNAKAPATPSAQSKKGQKTILKR